MSEPPSFLIKNEGIQMEPCETILQQPSLPPAQNPEPFEANQLPEIPLICFVFKK